MIKAVLMGDDGRELLVVRRPTAVLTPRPGWSEQDMGAVLQAVTECVTEAARGAAEPVSRLAVTAQGDGAWLVDADGRPVRNAVLWNDARAADVVDAWTRDGLLDEAFRRNGSVGNRGLPHAIMRWLEDHEPAALEQRPARRDLRQLAVRRAHRRLGPASLGGVRPVVGPRHRGGLRRADRALRALRSGAAWCRPC